MKEYRLEKSVRDVATRKILTVRPTMKVAELARIFDEKSINAAPVVNGFGQCIGMVTSRDIVRYESIRSSLDGQYQHGLAFDLVPGGEGEALQLSGRPFDEVAYHMTADIKEIGGSESVQTALRIMCKNEVHHLVLLDGARRPVGIISMSDILTDCLLDEPSHAHGVGGGVEAGRE